MHNLIRIFILSLSVVTSCIIESSCKDSKQLSPKPIGSSDTSLKHESSGNASNELTLHQTLDWLRHANPDSDAIYAIKKGDLHFMGVMGFALEVPGVKDYEKRYSTNPGTKIGVKLIPGTSDASSSEDEERLNDLAREYATRFNKIILNQSIALQGTSKLKPEAEPLVMKLHPNAIVEFSGKFQVWNGWPPNLRFVTDSNKLIGLDDEHLLSRLKDSLEAEAVIRGRFQFKYIRETGVPYFEKPLLVFRVTKIIKLMP